MSDLSHYPGGVAAASPDRPAVIFGDDLITYADLDDMACRIARLLHDYGVRRGDHVAMCMENRSEYLAIAWGCAYAGTYFTPISSRLHGDELAYILDDCGARVVFVSAAKADAACAAVASTPNVEHRFSVGGEIPDHLPLDDELAAVDPTPLPDRIEGRDMMYSSGTTGHPKGVKNPITGDALGTMTSFATAANRLFGVTDGCVYLSPAPLYHAAPLRFCMAAHRLGGTVVVQERFDPEQTLALIEEHQVTTAQFVPTMFVRMLKLEPEVRAGYDVTSLTHATHAAAPCPVDVKQQMMDWWGPIIHEYYTGTEGAGFCYISPQDWLDHPGSVGKPIRGQVHIVGEDGAILDRGATGAVYFDSGSTFEYHNDPDKTRVARTADGWATLGDIGHLDDDGFLYLTERQAFTINSGGVNIYPQEAENVLTLHPAVADVAVFGVPNTDFGEEVKAVVQPATPLADEHAEAALAAQLIEHCRERLSAIKCPRSVDFRAELPREPTGKLHKKKLRAEYWPTST